MSLIPCKHREALTCCVTVVDTVAITHVVNSAERAGLAVGNAEREKTKN